MTLEARHRQILRRRAAIAAIIVVAVVGLLIALWTVPDPEVPPTPLAPADPAATATMTASPDPVAVIDPSQAPAPGMDPELAPPDGPAPDSPPFDVDAVAMQGELATHGVHVPDDQLDALVAVADKYIAEGDPDLDAWDPRIMRDVRALDPSLSKAQVIDVTRCTAEYIERVIARNHGWAHPPDEDDHGATVDGRKPQPRVGERPVVTPTS